MSAVPLVGTALPPQQGVAWLPPSSEPRAPQNVVKNTMAGGTPMIVTVLGALAGTLVALVVLMYLYWRFLRQPKSQGSGQYTVEGGARGARHGREGMVAAVESRPPFVHGAEHIPTTFPVVVIEPDKTIKIAVEDAGTNLSHGVGSGVMCATSPHMPLPVVIVVDQAQSAGSETGHLPLGNPNNLRQAGQEEHGQRQHYQRAQQEQQQHERHQQGHQQQQPRLSHTTAPLQLPSATEGSSDDGELCVAYEERERRRRAQQAVPLSRPPIFPGWGFAL